MPARVPGLRRQPDRSAHARTHRWADRIARVVFADISTDSLADIYSLGAAEPVRAHSGTDLDGALTVTEP